MKAPIQHRDAAEPEPSQAGGAQVSALGEMANRSPRVQQQKALNEMAAASPRANHTGLPDQLKAGVEALSGISMDHVKVHYNSARPAQLRALAYAQGSEIHLGPGQEQHLPHEAWHVVQQQQGRVAPTVQARGVDINDDVGLEQEADRMGALAERAAPSAAAPTAPSATRQVLQALTFSYRAGKKNVAVDTDDFDAFTLRVGTLASSVDAVGMRTQLTAAVGDSAAEAEKHKPHFALLAERIATLSANELFADEDEATERKEKSSKKKEEQKVKQADHQRKTRQEAIKQKNPDLPGGLMGELFTYAETPPSSILALLKHVYTVMPAPERGDWSNLIVRGFYGATAIEAGTLDCLLKSGLTLVIATDIVHNRAERATIARITVLVNALAVRGGAAGQVSLAVSDAALCGYIFTHDATLVQLCLLNLAPLRAYDALMSTILAFNLTAAEVQLIAALVAVPLPVCRTCIADLRVLTPQQAAELQLAAAAVTAGGGAVNVAAFGLMCPLVRNGVPGLALGNLTAYVSGTVLYPNVAAADLFGIVENNGALATLMLQQFNAKLPAAPAMTWGLRGDLAGAGAGLNLYAPLTMAAGWNIGFEIISDIFNWRGVGGSHGCFTFAQIEAARQAALGAIPGGVLTNQARVVMVGGRAVTIVLNRGGGLIVTMYG